MHTHSGRTVREKKKKHEQRENHHARNKSNGLFVFPMLIGLFNCNQFDCFWLSRFKMLATLKATECWRVCERKLKEQEKFFHLQWINMNSKHEMSNIRCVSKHFSASEFFPRFVCVFAASCFSLKQFYFSFRFHCAFGAFVVEFCHGCCWCHCSLHGVLHRHACVHVSRAPHSLSLLPSHSILSSLPHTFSSFIRWAFLIFCILVFCPPAAVFCLVSK